MNKTEAITFLLNIATEIKRSLERPVILVTYKDYAEDIFKLLVDIRKTLLENADTDKVARIISKFHLQWLQAVDEIQQFKKRIKEIPRSVITDAIDFTIKCVQHRYKYFEQLVDQGSFKVDSEDDKNVQSDLEIINDMLLSVKSVLVEKKNSFIYQADRKECTMKVIYEIKELLNWLDGLNDCLAIQFSKVIYLRVPQLLDDLTETLKKIIKEVASRLDAPKIAKAIKKQKAIINSGRSYFYHDLEISKIVTKIKILKNRITRLKGDSLTLQALQHKLIYSQEQLQYLKDLRLSLKDLKAEQYDNSSYENKSDNAVIKMFNHNLPTNDRQRLVEQLLIVWDNALDEKRKASKPTVPYLSVADLHAT